jgi:hypothetical protein
MRKLLLVAPLSTRCRPQLALLTHHSSVFLGSNELFRCGITIRLQTPHFAGIILQSPHNLQ